MKNIYTSLLFLTFYGGYAQSYYGAGTTAASQGSNTNAQVQYTTLGVNESCNTVVVNDTDEQNGVFISGPQGQKAAVDIPIAANQQITITGIKVILTSLEVPTYAHFRFYNGTMSEANEEDGTAAALIPNETLFDVTDTEITNIEEIAYLEMQNMYVREVTLSLTTPVVLNGSEVDGRYWMGVLSDANAWGTTAHYDTGEGVVGESVAMGSNNSDWFQLGNLEGLYELTAECSTLAINDVTVANTALYPNPAKDTFTVALTSQAVISGIEVYSISGQKIKDVTAGSAAINISDLASGIYIIKTYTADATYTNKLIKQ